MAIEKIGQMTYVDAAGNEYLLFPKTKAECVKGLTPKAVGAAPAGYGLGESAPPRTIEDCNAVTQNGWYRTSGSTLNQPIARANWMRVDSHGTSYCHQTWFNDQYSGCIAERFMLNGVWQPWEWVNPPAALGVEYRTTERCEGKPVYAKRINCFAAPASVSISDLNIEKVVRWSGFVTYYGVALPCINTSWKVDISRTTISTTSAYEQASAHFYIDLYYTKN